MSVLLQALVILLISTISVNSLHIISIEEQSCVVRTDEGILNLTRLAGDKYPAFSFVFDTVYTLYWNPCKNVLPIYCEGSGGSGESLFGTSIGSGPSICKNLGLKNESEFSINYKGQLMLTYEFATVTFVCKSTAKNNTFSVPNVDDKTTAELIGPGACLIPHHVPAKSTKAPAPTTTAPTTTAPTTTAPTTTAPTTTAPTTTAPTTTAPTTTAPTTTAPVTMDDLIEENGSGSGYLDDDDENF